jgi:hypothetical protein
MVPFPGSTALLRVLWKTTAVNHYSLIFDQGKSPAIQKTTAVDPDRVVQEPYAKRLRPTQVLSSTSGYQLSQHKAASGFAAPLSLPILQGVICLSGDLALLTTSFSQSTYK